MTRRRRGRAPVLDALENRSLLTAFTPVQLTHAYGLDAVTFSGTNGSVKGDGSGQTIAIVVAYHDPTLAADLHTFDLRYGLPDPTLTVTNLAGSATDDGWAGEEAMDVEWAHAVAPGAKILVVEARSASTTDLIAAVDVARNAPGVSVVSMSWGGSEWSGQAVLDSHFTTPAGHTGVTFIAASGDSGVQAGAEWPSSSANVVAVGGTTLQLNSSGNYGSERLWSGSGSGTSRYTTEPTYQRTLQKTGKKVTADVAMVGDPNTGVMVYSTRPSTHVGSWGQYGGTSLGAPVWAGLVAIADQGRALAGKGTLDGPTQTLPALYALPSGDWHRIANVTYTSRRTTLTQTAGLGTPAGPKLVTDLAGLGTAAPAIRPAASTPKTFGAAVVYGSPAPGGSSARFSQGSLASAPSASWFTGVSPRSRNVNDSGVRPAALFGAA